MSAQSPLQLLTLFIIIPLVLAAALSYKKGRVFRQRLTGMKDADSPGIFGTYFVKCFLSTLFFCLFVVFSVLALAGISWGTSPEPEHKSGLDIVIVIDVSRSMLAADSSPSRLQAAADISLGLIQSLHRSRFAVVAFKGDAVLAIPMTEDRQVLDTFFQELGPQIVSTPGTHIEAGLELALAAFPAGISSYKAIILLSDGEIRQGNPAKSAEKAQGEGIPVFVVGMGGESGSLIRLPGGGTITGKDGKPVITRLDSGVLKTIAAISQGEYFSYEPGIVFRLTQKLQDFEDSRSRMGFRLVPVRRYRGFLFFGFLSLCAAVLTRSIRWKKK